MKGDDDMRFDCTDFEDMREWILTLPAPHPAMQEWRIPGSQKV